MILDRWVRRAAQGATTVSLQAAAVTCRSMAGVTVAGAAVATAGAIAVQPLLQPLGKTTKELPGVLDDVINLVDPRRDRHRRRAWEAGDVTSLEVRGLSGEGPTSRLLADHLDQRLAATAGVLHHAIDEVWGRVTVHLDPAVIEAADIAQLVAGSEVALGTAEQPWSRHRDHPGDREPVLAAGLSLAANGAALVLATVGHVVPVPGPPRVLSAAVALVDAQPRVRRMFERRLGVSRTDLFLSAAAASAQSVNRDTAALVVETAQRAALLGEAVSRRQAFRRWSPVLHDAGGPTRIPAVEILDRPSPLPDGPIERTADETAAGSLLGALASIIGGRGLGEVADALLVGVPRASRVSRETFAATLSSLLTRRGVLPLDRAAWRRLDRVDTVLIDGAVLHGSRQLVLDAEPVVDEWPLARVWAETNRLLKEPSGQPDEDGLRALRLRPDGRSRPSSAGRPRWCTLTEHGRPIGWVLIGAELDPRADSVLSTARLAGLQVVLAADASTSEVHGRADELVPAGAPLSPVVRRLQGEGHVVAVLSHSAEALASADLGIGIATRAEPPWTGDLLVRGLDEVDLLLAATRNAREVSSRGRRLALSASILGALLLVAGPRPGARLRVGSPITAAAFVGLGGGAWAALRAARRVAPPLVPLVPWHALEASEVLERLPAAPDPPTPEPARLAGESAPAGRRIRQGLRRVGSAGLDLAHNIRQELDDPLTPVLSVGAAASAVLGSPTDAVLVGSVMGVNALVSALQHQRADRALRRLLLGESVSARLVTAPGARSTGSWDAERQAELVPAARLRAGDVIELFSGDVIPADARLLAVEDLEVDESGLTGESTTVVKQVAATPGAGIGERACMVFDGTTATAGRGRAVVVATGTATQSGRAVAAVGNPPVASGVQNQLTALTDKALPLTLAGGAGVTLLGMLRGQRLRGAVADGVAVAVAAVPEGLPLVATVAQLAAAQRLSRRGVLVRSSRTVEALGRVDTMCFDKTGTLTLGRLDLVGLADLDDEWTPEAAAASPDARRLLRAAARACEQPDQGEPVHATDRAIVDSAQVRLGRQATHVWDALEEVPFESTRGYAATLGHTRRQLRMVVKGAPEVLLARCDATLRHSAEGNGGRRVQPFPAADRKAAEAVVHRLAARGLRVLAVARRDLTEVPGDVEGAVEHLTLMGFVALADTPRPETVPVLDVLDDAGISTRMITGDHAVTARAIAEQLGICSTKRLDADVVTGPQLDAAQGRAGQDLIAQAKVFARMSPEQKVRIVAALQASGRVVAMTGDGSNDAAAIRLADVGIGIAAHGSAAARKAADLVLTTPDITLLLESLVEGRAMWQRVRDAVAILVGGNAGEVAFTLLGSALAGRAPIGTRQFLLVNLLTDMLPAMAVALAGAGVPQLRGPTDATLDAATRAGDAGRVLALIPPPELGRELLGDIALRGGATAAGAGAAWLTGRLSGRGRRASTMGLVALVGTQLGQTMLVGGRSPLVWATVLGSGAALVAIVQTPGVSRFFGCVPLGPVAWTTVAVSATGATVLSAVLPRAFPVLARRLATASLPDLPTWVLPGLPLPGPSHVVTHFG